MTTPPSDPLEPLGTADPTLGVTTPYSTGEYDTVSTGGYDTVPTGQYETSSTPSATDTAKDEAKNVKDAAAGATQQVATTAKEQADKVVSDVREQTRQLAGETRNQLSSQAAGQRDKAVGSLRSLGDELRGMSDQSGQSGLGTQLAREGADLTHKVADFIEQREPAQLLDEVRGYARRKPSSFLIGAAVAGAVVGRLTRGAVAARQSDDTSSATGSGDYPRATPSSYLGTQADLAPAGGYVDPAVGYGSPQMDQLAYPVEGTEATYATDTGTYAPEEPGPYDLAAEDPTTSYPPEQGYRS